MVPSTRAKDPFKSKIQTASLQPGSRIAEKPKDRGHVGPCFEKPPLQSEAPPRFRRARRCQLFSAPSVVGVRKPTDLRHRHASAWQDLGKVALTLLRWDLKGGSQKERKKKQNQSSGGWISPLFKRGMVTITLVGNPAPQRHHRPKQTPLEKTKIDQRVLDELHTHPPPVHKFSCARIQTDPKNS